MISPLLRRAFPEDSDLLALIGRATFLETYAHMIAANDLAHHCQHQHNSNTYHGYLSDGVSACWMAVLPDTGTPVGYALLTSPDLPIPLQPGDLELKRIYVLSKFQRHGLGRALLEATVAEARMRGAPRLLLGTYNDNQTAIGFYRQLGFTQIGTRHFQVGATIYNDIVMACHIAD